MKIPWFKESKDNYILGNKGKLQDRQGGDRGGARGGEKPWHKIKGAWGNKSPSP